MMTFGDLAIGEIFYWPEGGGPITKVDATHYEFTIHGGRPVDGQWPDGTPRMATGTAEPHYRVRRTRTRRTATWTTRSRPSHPQTI